MFNSAFYGQTLSEREIRAVYDYYRSPLTHNSALAPGVLLNKGISVTLFSILIPSAWSSA